MGAKSKLRLRTLNLPGILKWINMNWLSIARPHRGLDTYILNFYSSYFHWRNPGTGYHFEIMLYTLLKDYNPRRTGPMPTFWHLLLLEKDEHFQNKCHSKLAELKEQGVTMVVVSHDLDSLRDICDRVIWLKDGNIETQGNKDEVIDRYVEYIKGENDE